MLKIKTPAEDNPIVSPVVEPHEVEVNIKPKPQKYQYLDEDHRPLAEMTGNASILRKIIKIFHFVL